MAKNKSSISQTKSYQEIADFWDTHDLSDYWDKTKEVKFEVGIESEKTYYGVEKNLAEKMEKLAKNRGVSGDILINLWIQEKLKQQKAL